MANEGGTNPERAISFTLRLIVSLIIPLWGLIMLVLGLLHGEAWWIASGGIVLAIGAIFLCGSSNKRPSFLAAAIPAKGRALHRHAVRLEFAD
jgi:hypothetical protein